MNSHAVESPKSTLKHLWPCSVPRLFAWCHSHVYFCIREQPIGSFFLFFLNHHCSFSVSCPSFRIPHIFRFSPSFLSTRTHSIAPSWGLLSLSSRRESHVLWSYLYTHMRTNTHTHTLEPARPGPVRAPACS